MSVFKRTIAVIALAAIMLFMIRMPRFAEKMMSRNQYREWLEGRNEPFRGIIKVWHIAGFKPYIGSLGSWLKGNASKIEKKHFGVYFDIESVTVEEAESRMAAGESPDMFSFPFGMFTGSELCRLSGEYETDISSGMDMSVLKAVPYAASCNIILYYPNKISVSEILENIESAGGGSAESFKKGKTGFCAADAREAGNLMRALTAGKIEYFDTLPTFHETKLIQYLGISADCAEIKKAYIEELICFAVSEKAQSGLSELGLMPLNRNAKINFEQPFLTEAYALLKEYLADLPNTFDFQYLHSLPK